MQSFRTSIVVLVLFACVFPSAGFAQVGFETALPCPNAHLATQQEADAASPKGSIIPGVTYVCPTDAPLGISNDAGAAKDYLRSILCPPDGDNYGGMGPDETIRGLDSKFAVCAASMLKSLNSSTGGYCVREGKRSVEKQNEYVARGVLACKKGAQCEHPRGIAIDINSKFGNKQLCDPYKPAHQIAPQFGLTFYLGCGDAYHFVPQKAGCTAGGTAPSYGGSTGGSFPTGGTNSNGFLPSSFYDYPQYAPSQASSFISPLNALTSAFTQPTTAQSNTYQPVTTPTYEPIVLPTPTSSVLEIPSTYVYPTTTPAATRSSVFERIELIAGGGTSTPTSSRTPTSQSISEIAATPTNPVSGTSNISEVYEPLAIAENSVQVDPILVTETFSGNEPVPAAKPVERITSPTTPIIVALLTTLRDLLVSFVTALKSRPTLGFEGPWQLPQQAPVFR